MKFDTQIIDLVRKGLTTQDIVNATGKSRATIYRSVKAYNNMLTESGSSTDAEGQPPRIVMKDDTDINDINSEWVLRRLVDISSGADGSAGTVQITALKAILDMVRSKEVNPAEMSLTEKVEWLKRSMTPDEFIVLSDGWAAEDREKVFRHLEKTFAVQKPEQEKPHETQNNNDVTQNAVI